MLRDNESMASTKRETYHHGDLRAALLDVAAEMIAAGGIESVTLRALSERTGVSRTAPYRHFADKSVLLAAVAEEGFKRLLQHLRAVEQREGDVLTRFQQMGVAYIQFAVENPTHYRLMFSHERAQHDAHPGLAAAGKAVFDSLVTGIQACQAAGRMRAGDPRGLAYVAWATVHGLASLLIDGQLRAPGDVGELAAFTTQRLLEGLAA